MMKSFEHPTLPDGRFYFEVAEAEKWKERRKVMEAIQAYGFGREWDIYMLRMRYNRMFALCRQSDGEIRIDPSKLKEPVHFHYHVKRLLKDGVVKYTGTSWNNRKEYTVVNQPVVIAQFNVAAHAGKSHKKRTRRKAANVVYKTYRGDDLGEKGRVFTKIEEVEEYFQERGYYALVVEIDGKEVGKLDKSYWRDRPYTFTPDGYKGYNVIVKKKFYSSIENFAKAARQRKVLNENLERA